MAPGADSVLDLGPLREALGDDALVAEVLVLFEADSAELCTALARDHAAGDCGALADTAHTLKGAARNVGALMLGDACYALERVARAVTAVDPAVARAVATVAAQHRRVIEQLGGRAARVA